MSCPSARTTLVHAVGESDVSLTMIGGQVVVEDGVLKTAELAGIVAGIVGEARQAAFARFARLGAP